MTEPPPNDFLVMVKPAGARCNLDCAYYYLAKGRMFPHSLEDGG